MLKNNSAFRAPRFCVMLLVCSFVFSLSAFAAPNGELILKVELDTSSVSILNEESRSYVNSAYNRFLQDILGVPQISVRTSSVDENMRQIQKQSQIDAAVGMGSENSAYATDKDSRADLAVIFFFEREGGSKCRLSCKISEIESKNLKSIVSTDRLPLNEAAADVSVDKLAYETLVYLQKSKHISGIPSGLVTQLLHKESSADANKIYISDIIQQIEETEKAKQALKDSANTEQEKAEAASKAQALQLKLDMLERTRQQAEEAQRRKQEEEMNAAKRRQELEELDAKKQDEINKEIKLLEDRRAALRQEVLKQLSMKRRIELIEDDKASYAHLKQVLAQNIKQTEEYYDAMCRAEVQAKENEPWQKGDTDRGGMPTELARKFRASEINDIVSKYDRLKKSTIEKLNASAKPGLDSYEAQIRQNLSEMEKTFYVFRSIDQGNDFVTLRVDEFDGNDFNWLVHTSFRTTGIPKIDSSDVILPDAAISYTLMTGKEPPDIKAFNADNPKSRQAYEEYRDLVTKADFFFHVSVPYLYSEIAVEVRYSQEEDLYKLQPYYFRIIKMSNDEAVYNMSKTGFEAEKKRALDQEKAAIKQQQEEERELARKQIEEIKKQKKQEEDMYRARLAQVRKQNFLSNQIKRSGMFVELGIENNDIYGECFTLDLQFLGGKSIFFGGGDIGNSTFKLSGDAELSIADFGILGGLSFSFGFNNLMLRPYAGVGLGLSVLNSEVLFTDSDLKTRLYLKAFAGADLIFMDYLTLGISYTTKYIADLGTFNSFNFSFGIGIHRL